MFGAGLLTCEQKALQVRCALKWQSRSLQCPITPGECEWNAARHLRSGLPANPGGVRRAPAILCERARDLVQCVQIWRCGQAATDVLRVANEAVTVGAASRAYDLRFDVACTTEQLCRDDAVAIVFSLFQGPRLHGAFQLAKIADADFSMG